MSEPLRDANCAATLREDEAFVMRSLALAYSASWRPGENPPDAYLAIGNKEIAVEISTLTQHVRDDRGTRARISDDTVAVALANELNDELGGVIPDGHTIGLILSSPILKFRKTKSALALLLRSELLDPHAFTTDALLNIQGNAIKIFRNNHGDSKYKKVSGIISHRSASADILDNTAYILEDRIRVKAEKCASLATRETLWLALRNDYWLTDGDTYRYALRHIPELQHPFEKVVLIARDGSAEELT
jgi:hypothetical protein